MKKLLVFVFICIILGFGVYYYTHRKAPSDPMITHYTNTSVGLSFTYPKILSASTTDGTVSLHHEIPFTHHDYCDFKGEGTTTIPTLTDFGMSMHIMNKDLVGAMKAESPYIPEENFVNNQVVPSPGFIDSYSVGNLNGYKIFEGAEGCGQTTYYFPISASRTLVVRQEYITIFSGAIDPDQGARALQVPGVITKEQNELLFENILKTLTY